MSTPALPELPALLTADQEHELGLAKAAGSAAARERLVAANLRLVMSVARRYLGRGLDLEDLVQEGSVGLLRAADGFDPDAGCRFSTYAVPAIQHSILSAIERQARTIRIPVRPLVLRRQSLRAEEALTKALERRPTDEEVALELGVSPRELRRLRRQTDEPVSLETPVGEGATELGDLVPDPGAVDPELGAEQRWLRDEVQRALSSLSQREREVVVLRFGIGSGDGARTLEEIAGRLSVTRERVRQLETRALRKLRQGAGFLEAFAA